MPSTRNSARIVASRQASRRRARKRALARLKQSEETGDAPLYPNPNDRLNEKEASGEDPFYPIPEDSDEEQGNSFGKSFNLNSRLKNNLKDINYLNK
jgi:hypothetical protein